MQLTNKILGITIPTESKQNTLEKIKKYTLGSSGFQQIISLNPENIMIARDNPIFKEIVETAQIKVIDGSGIVVAGRLLGVSTGDRYPGINLMTDLLRHAGDRRLRVLLIGGKANLAHKIAKCYTQIYPEAKFTGIEGYGNVEKPEGVEEKNISSIVSLTRPHLVFVAFGSPVQEIWLDRHKDIFSNSVCMGVGGGFDFLGQKVARAPIFLQKFGLEWLFRLIIQPWRWKRQMRLVQFCSLVLKQKMSVNK